MLTLMSVGLAFLHMVDLIASLDSLYQKQKSSRIRRVADAQFEEGKLGFDMYVVGFDAAEWCLGQ